MIFICLNFIFFYTGPKSVESCRTPELVPTAHREAFNRSFSRAPFKLVGNVPTRFFFFLFYLDSLNILFYIKFDFVTIIVIYSFGTFTFPLN